MEWLYQNKEWLFSGIGLAVLSAIVGLLFKGKNRKGNQNINTGDGSVNMQSERDIEINIGDKNAKR